MKFSLSWLKTHLETDAPLSAIAETLTNLGLEVEDIHNPGDYLQNFTVAHILETAPHPDADRLRICQVNIGGVSSDHGEILQIVCGAPNARPNLKVAFAKPGTYVHPLNITLKKSTIRGVESNGMLCSEYELNLAKDSDGILELPTDAPVGQNLAEFLGKDDPVITIKITPNRGDCLGVRGIARDLAAAGLGTLKPLTIKSQKNQEDKATGPLKILNHLSPADQEACPHFLGRFIQGVKNAASPQWLQDRLKSVGLTPISALVDITNFISYDLGRPLHVFDGDKVQDMALIIRTAGDQESFTALNSKTYILQAGMTVVADANGPIALAGVMGGADSGCYSDTHNVILEAAYFDPIRTAKTGRALDIKSDARYRFERGVGPESTRVGLEYATQLILDLCGGKVIQTIEVGSAPTISSTISYEPDLIRKVGGIEIDPSRQGEILTLLGCIVHQDAPHQWQVTTPSWRHDLKIPQDLVEEILRIQGYNQVAPKTPEVVVNKHIVNSSLSRSYHCRYALAHRGLQETVTWSMVSQSMMQHFGGAPENLRISNPISLELEYLRPSVLPHLITAAQRNIEKGNPQVHLFEIGPHYYGSNPGDQHMAAAIVRTGTFHQSHWSHQERGVDMYDVKGDVLAILNTVGIGNDQIQLSTTHLPTWYHPGRAGVIHQGPKNRLAVFGELHPAIAKSLSIKERIMMAEIFMDALPLKKGSMQRPALHLSPYQPVERDFSFIVDAQLSADTLLQAVKKTHRSLITAADIFDIFYHESLGADKKALGVRVKLEPHERTLTEEDIQSISKDIIAAIEKIGGILR